MIRWDWVIDLIHCAGCFHLVVTEFEHLSSFLSSFTLGLLIHFNKKRFFNQQKFVMDFRTKNVVVFNSLTLSYFPYIVIQNIYKFDLLVFLNNQQ